MPPHNDSPMIADLVRDGYLQEVAYTVAGTEYAITSAGKEHVAERR
jgi:DNA-binding PadR family transcriptional regulator